jgi:hypothetical protein
LNNEDEVLKRFRGKSSTRQLLDEVQDPPSLILEHLNQNPMDTSNEERISRTVVKRIEQKMLEAMVAAHDENLVHTGLYETKKLFCPLHD